MLRAVYVDLDGTLLGPGGSLFSSPDGGFSLDATRALQACSRADVEVVIYSGRRQVNVYDVARLIGQRSYIFELGCGLVLDGELEWLTDGVVPSEAGATIWDQIRDSGAPELLASAFPGRLEEHSPWSFGRDVSHLYRGEVDLREVEALLADSGYDWLRLVDNGVISSLPSDFGLDVDRVHVYHLIPVGSSKVAAVARHKQNRGYTAADCIAIGDSREDMDAASEVGAFWLVANALERDPTIVDAVAGRPNVRLAETGYGAGVYEAIVTTLAEG